MVLYHGGEQSLADFAAAPRQRDILTHVIIPKGERRVVYLSQRNTATDFPRPHLRPVPAGGADAVRRGGPARAGGAL